MATVNSELVLIDRMSATLTRIENSAKKAENTFDSLNKKISNTDNVMKKTSSSAGSLFSSMLKANLVSSAISKLTNLITGQLSNAISRFDTLNNYTKVMHNLGISEEAANASRERLANGLKGLPTTLDSAALAVQRFTAANEDVKASTEMYLALNNALLAGGAPQELQASAMEQWAQAYSKGKPDMMEWRTLLQAMPGQLNQIAKAMNKTTDQLGEDLRNGKTSMNDFMATAVELNQKGIEGFENFEEQAKKATGGIGTAIANLKSAVARGWAQMFEGANQALEASGLPTISQIITNLGIAIEETMARIGTDAIPTLGMAIQGIIDQFGYWGQAITNTYGVAEETTMNSLTLMDYLIIGAQVLGLGIQFAIAAIQIAFLSLWLAAQALLTGIGGVMVGLEVAVGTAMKVIVQAVQDAVNNVIGILNTLINAFNAVFGALGAHIDNISEMTFAQDFGAGVDNYLSKELNGIADLGDGVMNTYDQMVELSKLTSGGLYEGATNVQNLPSKLAGGGAGKAAGGSSYSIDPQAIRNLGNTVGNSGSGGNGGGSGKAIKTTSTDKNLLSDDDIQLLLDVATRDYKLNYQQVTPNITLTFGDIRETANVDEVLDKVADRLEEIYDGNLEVANG